MGDPISGQGTEPASDGLADAAIKATQGRGSVSVGDSGQLDHNQGARPVTARVGITVVSESSCRTTNGRGTKPAGGGTGDSSAETDAPTRSNDETTNGKDETPAVGGTNETIDMSPPLPANWRAGRSGGIDGGASGEGGGCPVKEDNPWPHAPEANTPDGWSNDVRLKART